MEKGFFKKITDWCSTHRWQTAVICVAIIGIVAASISVPVALNNKNKEPEQYTVEFNMMNHGSQIESITVESGSKITKPSDPTAEGYTFGNWYKEESLSNIWNFDVDTVSKNTVLYGKWDINQYQITWDIEGQTSTETYNYGEMPNYKNGTPSKAATAEFTYSFTGWSPELVNVTADKTYTAQFSSTKNSYVVSFIMGGHGTEVTSQTVEYGSKVTKPSDPTASGFNFKGWYKDSSFSTAWNFDTDVVTQNVSIYAKWEEVAIYAVRFNAFYGSYIKDGNSRRIDTLTESFNYAEGTTFTINDVVITIGNDTYTAYQDGCPFAYWYVDFGSEGVDAGKSYTGTITSNICFEPNFEPPL